jgi:SAM-dependent methyltransferase
MRDLVRFALPPDAVIAVAGPRRRAHDLPLETRELPPQALGGGGRIDVDALRDAGIEFVLVPEDAGREPLSGALRLAIDEPGAGSIFAVDPVERQRFRAPDRLPLPPPELLRVVMRRDLPRGYWVLGALGADCIRSLLWRHGADMADFETVLDFGCGCGRVMRHWKWLKRTELHGSDYNPYLVRWCAENLPFARYEVNALEPPLPYGDGTFRFVYAISVFTHLDEEGAHAWMSELARVLCPGGLLYITTHGEKRAAALSDAERERFAAGEPVVVEAGRAGTNACAAYHPERYVRERLAPPLELLDSVPDGAEDVDQDAYLLRKRPPG